MHRNESRPLSPHLGIYRWGPHMAVSILHRATGAGGALVGGALLLWWLGAAAGGAASYGRFTTIAANPWMLVIWVPLSWGIIQHTLSGLRHLVMDIGAGFELGATKRASLATLAGSLLLTALLWFYLMGVR